MLGNEDVMWSSAIVRTEENHHDITTSKESEIKWDVLIGFGNQRCRPRTPYMYLLFNDSRYSFPPREMFLTNHHQSHSSIDICIFNTTDE